MRLNPPIKEYPVNPAIIARARVQAILDDPKSHEQWAKRPVREKAKKTGKVDLNKKTHDLGRSMGYWAYRADYWDGIRKEQHDYLGIFDWVWYPMEGPGPIVHVQHTTTGHTAERKAKILKSFWYGRLKKCGCRVLLIGWTDESGKWEAVLEWL